MPQRCLQEQEITTSMEGLQLVSLHRCFVFVQVCEWVLGTIVVCIIVSIDRLSFEPGNGVELLDCGRTETSESPEHGSLNFSDLSILNGIDKSVLGFRCMILQLLGSVLLAERSNLIEVHLKIMRHLLGKFIPGARPAESCKNIAFAGCALAFVP